MNKPHVHVELIKKWADGFTIQYQVQQDFGGFKVGDWVDCVKAPVWGAESVYRVKPEVTTSLSDEQLYAISTQVWQGPRSSQETPLQTAYRAHRAMADAVLKQHIKENTN